MSGTGLRELETPFIVFFGSRKPGTLKEDHDESIMHVML